MKELYHSMQFSYLLGEAQCQESAAWGGTAYQKPLCSTLTQYYHRVGGRKRPRRDSVLLGTKAGPDMRSGLRGAWPNLFHVGDAVSLSLCIYKSIICLHSVCLPPLPITPPLGWTRGVI